MAIQQRTNQHRKNSIRVPLTRSALVITAALSLTLLGCRSDPPAGAAVNNAPVASSTTFNTANDSSIAGQLLATDADGDSLTYQLVAGPSGGTVSVAANGGFAYDPRADFSGSDSFSFRANDGTADSNIATITVNVAAPDNQAPVASNTTFNTANDSNVSGQLLAADGDGDTLTYRLITGPTGGTVSVATNGGFAYDPRADFSGQDSFTFRANDGTADSNTGTVTINVAAANQAPVAENQSITTDFQTQASGMLVASDGDNDALTYRLFSQSDNGTAVVNAGGSFTYDPDTGFSGTDSFTFRVNDGAADSNTATVTVTVNPAGNQTPTATDASFSTPADTPLDATVSGTDPDGDTLMFAQASPPSNGMLTFNSDGSFTYTPTGGFTGIDSFTFTANDGTATSDPATVMIDVGNAAPIADDQEFTGNEDELLTATILASDSNAGDTLTFMTMSQPASGELRSFNMATGEFTYLPARDFVGEDSFIVQVSDGRGGTDTATITLTIACPEVTGECDFDKLPLADVEDFMGARQPSLIVQTPAPALPDVTRPYVAFIEDSTTAAGTDNLIVRRFTGGAWETVDGDGSATGGVGDGVVDRMGMAANPDIKPALLLPLTVAVAWDEAGNIFVDRYGDLQPNWANISGNPNVDSPANGNARGASLAISTLSVPLVAFVESANRATGDAVVYNNTANTADIPLPGDWELLNQDDGALDVDDANAISDVSIATDDLVGVGLGSLGGRPIIAFSETDGGVSKVFVKRCNDTSDTAEACEQLAGELNIDTNTSANNPSAAVASFAIDLNVRPVVAFDEGGSVFVRRFEGGVWNTLDGGATDGAVDIVVADTATNPAVAVDLLGRIVVAWEEVDGTSGTSRIYIKRYNEAAGVFEQLGSILNCDIDQNANDVDVAFDTLARPYVAFTEEVTDEMNNTDTRIVVLRFTQP